MEEGAFFLFGVKNFFWDQRNGIGDGEDLRGGGGCIYIWCKEFFFGDQQNGIGDGEDWRDGGGCIYIAISDLTFEVMWCCRDLHTISHHSHNPHLYYDSHSYFLHPGLSGFSVQQSQENWVKKVRRVKTMEKEGRSLLAGDWLFNKKGAKVADGIPTKRIHVYFSQSF